MGSEQPKAWAHLDGRPSLCWVRELSRQRIAPELPSTLAARRRPGAGDLELAIWSRGSNGSDQGPGWGAWGGGVD
jgi:hypothetical protein